jgi:hypothetical protein
MYIEKSTDETGFENYRFDIEESAVLVSMFSERCRHQIQAGGKPNESDLDMVRSLRSMPEVSLTGDVIFKEFIRYALDQYARNTMAEAQAIQAVMGDEPGAANLALERMESGILAQEMVIEIEFNSGMQATGFLEEIDDFLEGQ